MRHLGFVSRIGAIQIIDWRAHVFEFDFMCKFKSGGVGWRWMVWIGGLVHVKAEIINNDTANGVDCGFVVDGWHGGMVGCGWYLYLRVFAAVGQIMLSVRMLCCVLFPTLSS